MMISDDAFGRSEIVLYPYPKYVGMTGKRRGFSFCFPSPRSYVEQNFGMWKHGWGKVLKESDISRPFLSLSLVVCATKILYNICMSYGVDGYAPESNELIDSTTLVYVMQNFPRDTCKKCKEAKKRHQNRTPVAASGNDHVMMTRRDEIAHALWEAHYREYGC
jgi:hypothetical protein